MLARCSFDCFPSFGFRLTRYGANAPGQTTSIIATSIDDDFDENARASCAYDWSDADGCGTTFTLTPVSLVNRFASVVSRTLPFPTESPTNVIVCPPYFLLIAAALGTLGAAIAAAFWACAGLLLLAVATLRKAMSASTPKPPARPSSLGCFTCPTSFLRPLRTRKRYPFFRISPHCRRTAPRGSGSSRVSRSRAVRRAVVVRRGRSASPTAPPASHGDSRRARAARRPGS